MHQGLKIGQWCFDSIGWENVALNEIFWEYFWDAFGQLIYSQEDSGNNIYLVSQLTLFWKTALLGVKGFAWKYYLHMMCYIRIVVCVKIDGKY